MVDEPINSKANLAGKNKRMKKVKKIDNIDANDATIFTSHSFYTTQAGVFMTRIDKRLGPTPSDKVVFPRAHFGSYSIGSRFCEAVRKFNSTCTYDELFTDEHLKALNEIENTFIAQHLKKYYPNGVQAETLIRLEEMIDHQVCVEYLVQQNKVI